MKGAIMKKILMVLGISLYWAWMCQVCTASPFLVSDPSAQAVGGQFEIKEGTTTILTANNQADGSVKADLKDVAVGVHTYQVRYIVTDPLWGTQMSVYVPFTFTRPSLVAPNVGGIKLVP